MTTNETGQPHASGDDEAEAEWLAAARGAMAKSDWASACAILRRARARFGASADVGVALAGALWQARDLAGAETVLRELLVAQPGHVAATLTLAHLLREQARMRAAEDVVVALFARSSPSLEVRIQAIELLDDCGRKHAAAALAEAAIGAGSEDPRIHAYAGMLDTQVGDFELARRRYAFTLDNDARALEWQSAYGYASSKRYASAADPDFGKFEAWLARPGLSAKARASLLFALGKMHDDVGDFAAAAASLREANALANTMAAWSRKDWRRRVRLRLDAKPIPLCAETTSRFRPVFVVGMPRSGTTLIADRLARFADVCDRGESIWLGVLAHKLSAKSIDQNALDGVAGEYHRQLVQDDAAAHVFIDKQPLNFLHLDLIAAAFPNARVVFCDRDPRDTALSIWSQFFAGSDYGFGYDFANLGVVGADCRRLLARARARHPDLIRIVRYEALVTDLDAVIGKLAHWIGLDPDNVSGTETRRAISTSSAWQVRQPVHSQSVGRWRAYAPYVPELRETDW